MNKLQKLLKSLQLIIKNPSLLNLILEHDANFMPQVISKYNYTNGLNKIDFNEFLQHENTLDNFSFLEGGSIVTDYLLLTAITKKLNQSNCFEIGTWRGESALSMSKYAKEVTTLNLSKDELKNLDFSQEYINLQGILCKNATNINQLWGNTFNFDFTPHIGKYDLVFVDGDHKYNSVVNDTKVASKLIKDNKSIIVWHDYGFGTETVRWEVLLGILDGLPKEMHKNLYSVNNTLCAIYYPYEVKNQQLNFPQSPNQLYTVKISENKK
ncbi:MAG: class I SAM-dependent methyltransferase [Bacteroidia bacterium]